jgi:hypothetical protein
MAVVIAMTAKPEGNKKSKSMILFLYQIHCTKCPKHD